MWRALLAVRWLAFAWLVVAASIEPLFRPRQITFALVLLVGLWTLWLTRSAKPLTPWVLGWDLAISVVLNLATGLLAPPDALDAVPVFGLAYSFSAVFLAGAAYGPGWGLAAGLLMGASYLAGRLLNGAVLAGAQLGYVVAGTAGLLAAGLGLGVVSSLLHRISRVTAQAIQDREKAARMAERESMARQIHDSVLQVLALIHKRGMELSRSADPSHSEIAELASMARDQEKALRGLFLRHEQTAPAGEASLRAALETAVAGVEDVDVTVSAVGPVWLPRGMLDELVAAVNEAMANVVKHSGATKATVFADDEQGVVQVTVRDNGTGFEYDEADLRAQGKFGVLNSMKGRVEGLGGTMAIESGHERGTEVEFRVPVYGPKTAEVIR